MTGQDSLKAVTKHHEVYRQTGDFILLPNFSLVRKDIPFFDVIAFIPEKMIQRAMHCVVFS